MKWVYWPTLQKELGDKTSLLRGKVLNAGAGTRRVLLPYAAEIVSCDIQPLPGVDVVCDLEDLPFKDGSFDGVLSVAVLEHCRHPWIAITEMSRVMKQGGALVCVVPFFQPIHNVPTDFFRFTPSGITSMLEDSGFSVDRLEFTHSIFNTLGWIGEDATADSLPWKIICIPLALTNFALSFFFRNCNIKTAPNVITIVARKK